jgi:hypothetical protein
VKLNAGSQFCHACGTKVIGDVVTETASIEAQTMGTAPTVEHKAPVLVEVKKGTPFVVIGWVSFGMSLVCFMSPIALPIIFGLIALIMGILVINVRHQTHGIVLAVLAVAGTLLSTALGHAVKTVIHHYYYYF